MSDRAVAVSCHLYMRGFFVCLVCESVRCYCAEGCIVFVGAGIGLVKMVRCGSVSLQGGVEEDIYESNKCELLL